MNLLDNQQKPLISHKILIVDDGIDNIVFITRFLQKKGLTIFFAKNGNEGLKVYEKCQPDLVITDVMMPGMDGFQFIERLRTINSTKPVIIVSALGSSIDKAFGLQIGADAYLTKPYNLEELFAIITTHLRRGRCLETRLKSLTELNQSLLEEIDELKKLKQGTVSYGNVSHYRAVGGAIAHSLKGEFLHISSSVNRIIESTDNTPEIQEECQDIKRSIGYSQILLKRLLNYLEIGKCSVKSINVLEVLKKVEQLIKPRISSNISLKLNPHTDANIGEAIYIYTDFEQLVGVVMELVQNAVTAMRCKGGTIQLLTETIDKSIAIHVMDNGPGIHPSKIKSLFKEQVSSSQGSGLGLYLGKKVIEELKGDLSVTTSESGTKFTIVLPLNNSTEV